MRFEDLTGQRFGRLLVEERAPNLGKYTAWLCKCDCGKYKVVPSYRLKSGETTSCGCLNRAEIQIEAGHRYGMLEAICLVPQPKTRKRHWLCRCDCGNLKYVEEYLLQTGQSKSCGCYRDAFLGTRSRTHGDTGSRLFNVWKSMKQRCYYPNCASYANYGGRGITVCDEWRNDYSAFREWALANGYEENAPRGECTIDRIDVDGNYEPSNCRWVDMKVQQNNRRNSKKNVRVFLGKDGIYHVEENCGQKVVDE